MLRNNYSASKAIYEQESRRLSVCMLVYAFYENDPRVQQYAAALLNRGDNVDVIALKHKADSPDFEIYNGVRLYRIQMRVRNERSLFDYGARIVAFLLRATVFLWKKNREMQYDLIHVHNVPDFLVFAAIAPRWNHIPIILDIHDLLPELYASKFKLSRKSWVFKVLTFTERYSVAFATHVIIANHLWRDRLISRSVKAEKCDVIRNYPEPEMFHDTNKQSNQKSGKFILTYPGTLNTHQGLDVAIRAFARVADEMKDLEFHIYGEGPAKKSLVELTNSLDMQERITFHDPLPRCQIAQVMARTDLAIEPKRATSAFGGEALSTKILEFMAVGVPVLASKTTIHAYYYDESIIRYYQNDSDDELAKQIRVMRNDHELRLRLAAKASEYVAANNWSTRRVEYLNLVDSLVLTQ